MSMTEPLRGAATVPPRVSSRYNDVMLYEAARLYYLEDTTQAETAKKLGTSRATVSRLLSEARATGIVHIEVRPPQFTPDPDLAVRCARALGLQRVWLGPSAHGVPVGRALGPAVKEALIAADLHDGDALLVSSGATVYKVSQGEMPRLVGVTMAPTVGGQNEPEARYQTNEITRQIAVKAHGLPLFLYAPALPSPDLYDVLMQGPSIQHVLELWKTAKAALLGVGAAPLTRTSVPSVLPRDNVTLADAVGDICFRPFDAYGQPVAFDGSERLLAMQFEDLRRLPVAIAVAAGANKRVALLAAARAGLFNQLVTNPETAYLLIEAAESGPT
jgi:DNA-binding transcriptional regulator LsrR (DeoR family)